MKAVKESLCTSWYCERNETEYSLVRFLLWGMGKMKVGRGLLREWDKQYEQANKKKREEKLSTRDIEDLMGVCGPRYERRRRAWRQK
ncbi:hypothetical protein P4283_22815 [Bacillus thuringiensis]|nr:hypothetical protein [Bacillus thuringiensis]